MRVEGNSHESQLSAALILVWPRVQLHNLTLSFPCVLLALSVIEVASGEYGENVIPSLVKAWRAREETMTQQRSLTSSTSCSYDSRNMVVSMLPNCNVKTSTDSIIEAASQTTQVNIFSYFSFACPDLTPGIRVH